jgi:hypothetical protein
MASPASDTKKTTRKSPQDHLTPNTATNWKRTGEEDVLLPSGNVAKVRRPGPVALLASGVMPDSLMPIINEAIRSGKGLAPEKTKEMIQDQDSIFEMLDGIDRAVIKIVVEPKVAYHRQEIGGEWSDIPQADRDTDEFIYTDEIDLDDKMFLFQFAVGGTRDLETFRRQSDASLGSLADEPGTDIEAK